MKPTKAELAWMQKLEDLLTNPPSDRIGLFTTGDMGLIAYDKTKDREIDKIQVKCMDFCTAVDKIEARLGNIRAKMFIHSTAA